MQLVRFKGALVLYLRSLLENVFAKRINDWSAIFKTKTGQVIQIVLKRLTTSGVNSPLICEREL